MMNSKEAAEMILNMSSDLESDGDGENSLLIELPPDSPMAPHSEVPMEQNDSERSDDDSERSDDDLERSDDDSPDFTVQQAQAGVAGNENATTNPSTPHSSTRATKNPSTSSKKISSIKEKYPILTPCCCKKKCIEKIPQESRNIIHDKFWEMESTDERRLWMCGNIKVQAKKSAKIPSMVAVYACKNRQVTRSYFLSNDGMSEEVCKTFFLRTLGYKHDTVITKMFASMTPTKSRPQTDKRGKHTPCHALSDVEKSLIDDHIKSFNPTISHYRRAHAPLRLYLPSELNVEKMFKWFKETNPGDRIGKMSYFRRVQQMNISFAKLGEEECEVCIEILHHECSAQNPSTEDTKKAERLANIKPGECQKCDAWTQHINKSYESRNAYRKDADTYPEPEKYCVSADLQKVIMLPRLPGVKKCVFTRRIIAFNETFAPLVATDEVKKKWRAEKKKVPSIKPMGMIWHEGIQGRNDEDICSAFVKLVSQTPYRSATSLTTWLDNCSGQGKNWTLYAELVRQVNMNPTLVEWICKYFEKGHTFMSADSFHHQVEKAMREMKNLYTFKDFEDCVEEKGKAIVMSEDDFFDFKKHQSTAKDTNYPQMKEIVEVKFCKGSTKMYWKTGFNEEYQSGEFLQKKFREKIIRNATAAKKGEPRGVQTAKKESIIKNIVPLMPVESQKFWIELPENESARDLTENYDHLPNDEVN